MRHRELARTALGHFGDRVLVHADAIRRISAGEIHPPLMAIIYPSSRCNCECVGCEYGEVNSLEGDLMPTQRLLELIDQVADLGARSIEFCGGGDPALHPDLAGAVSAAAGRGLKVGILTNGSSLDKSLIDALVLHASYVRISLDAAFDQTYRKIKKPLFEGGMGAVLSGIERLLSARDGSTSRLLIGLKMLVSRDNLSEIEDFARLGRRLGVDSIQFKGLRNHERSLSIEQARHADAVIAGLPYDDMAIVGRASKSVRDIPCFLTPLHCVIETSGDLMACCYYLHRRGGHRIGNVFETSLRDLWGSESHRRVIASIVPEQCDLFDCRFFEYNRLAKQLILDDGGQFDFI